MKLPLPKEKKMTVVCRIEPGCLGPEGIDLVEEFCTFAQREIETIDSDFIHWELVPRLNKEYEEMQYQVNGKNLSHEKAAKYLQIFDVKIDEFEDRLHDKLSELIDQHLGH